MQQLFKECWMSHIWEICSMIQNRLDYDRLRISNAQYGSVRSEIEIAESLMLSSLRHAKGLSDGSVELEAIS